MKGKTVKIIVPTVEDAVKILGNSVKMITRANAAPAVANVLADSSNPKNHCDKKHHGENMGRRNFISPSHKILNTKYQ